MKPSSSIVRPFLAPRRLAAKEEVQWKAPLMHAFMLLTRLAVGGVLVYAGSVKVSDTAAFSDVIANFELLPPRGYQTLAVVLPWVEIVLGLSLICGLFLRVSALLALLLGLIFGAAVISAMVRGLDIACGCFGTSDYASVGFRALAVDLAMVVASTLVLIFPNQSLLPWFHTQANRTDPARRGRPST